MMRIGKTLRRLKSKQRMDDIKIQQCREFWCDLAPHVQARAAAKHLIAAVAIAERLLHENNKLEMENRTLRRTTNEKAHRPGPL
jgi:hypothetical protein